MKERASWPMKGWEVRAILSGNRKMARRVAPIRNLEIHQHFGGGVSWNVGFSKPLKGALGSYSGGKFSESQARSIIASLFCPYGQPGDRLWVRETFALSVIDPDGLSPEDDPENYDVIYRADPEQPGGGWADSDGNKIPAPWKPSIHMPRWASRILLEIVSVRVERLQDISEEDARAEGCPWSDGAPDEHGLPTQLVVEAKDEFAHLWRSINGPASWSANPWVWAIEFKRVTP